MHTAVADVHAIENGVAQRSAALDDPPAHAYYVVVPDWANRYDRGRACDLPLAPEAPGHSAKEYRGDASAIPATKSPSGQ